MCDGGYAPLAVHAPWSPYVPETCAGKMPATEVINGQKNPWTGGHTQARLMRATTALSNTGVVLGGPLKLVALDIDPAKDKAQAEQGAFTQDVLRVMKDHPASTALQGALVRTRPPASVLVLLRADHPMTKGRVAGQRGAVELLAQGQQCLVDGYHPRSRNGTLIRWAWHRDRAPWTVPACELPVIDADMLMSLMQSFVASGVLGPAILCAASTRVVNGRNRASAYEAADRLQELLRKHDGLIRPAVRELIEQIGAEGRGRHDALVSICGRLVSLRWSVPMASDFLVPLVNQHFGDGDWTEETERALQHGQRRDLERFQQRRRKTVWTA